MPWYVNGELLDDTAVRDEARMMRPRYMESVVEMDAVEAEMQLREWARENVIERMLIRQTALADPEPVPPEYLDEALRVARTEAGGQASCGIRNSDEEVRSQAELEYKIQRLIAGVQSRVKPPSEKEIAAFYKANKEHFRTPELCRVSHIVKNVGEGADEAECRKVIEQAELELKSGADFEQVANTLSDCGGNGGDLGWFPRGQMVDEFEQVVFELPVGKTSDIFRTPFGFHIARTLGRKPAGVQPLADVREQIIETLTEERRQKALESFLDELRSRSEIRQVKATA